MQRYEAKRRPGKSAEDFGDAEAARLAWCLRRTKNMIQDNGNSLPTGEAVELDQIHLSAAIRACSKAGAWVMALGLLEEMVGWMLVKVGCCARYRLRGVKCKKTGN